MNQIIDSELIFINPDVSTKEEVLQFLSDELYKRGKVKEEFASKIIERESDFPTGLEVVEVNVAIPHTDKIYVNKSALAIAIVSPTINFNRMDNPVSPVDVSMIFMIAIDETGNHIKVIQTLIEFIQKQDVLKKIITMDDKHQIVELIKENI